MSVLLNFQVILDLLSVPVGTFINCARRPCFRASARGIGYSFQLAITTPRKLLIGYGTATAQSWRIELGNIFSTALVYY